MQSLGLDHDPSFADSMSEVASSIIIAIYQQTLLSSFEATLCPKTLD